MAEACLNGVKNPALRIKKLSERISHLEAEIDKMKDQIEIMQSEISRIMEAHT